MFKRLLMYVLAASIVLTSAYTAAAVDTPYVTGDNLAVNGDFESGINGWNTQGILSAQGDIVYRGSGAAVVSGRTDVTQQFYQNISLTKGTTYLYSAMVRLKDSEYDGAAVNLTVSGGTTLSSEYSSVEASHSEWTYAYRTLTAAEDMVVKISVSNYTDVNVDYYIDNIYFGAIDTSNFYAASAVLSGASAVSVPQNGTNTIRLRCEVFNQYGCKEGMQDLQNMDSWTLEPAMRGVSVDSGGVISVDYRAEGGVVTVTGILNTAKNSSTITVSRQIEIIPRNTPDGNLFYNGDFEGIDASAWEGDGMQVMSALADTGSFSACIPTGAQCGQRIWLEGGKTYYITAMANVQGTANTFEFASDNSEVIVSGEVTEASDDKWHRVTALADTSALSEDENVLIYLSAGTQSTYYADSFFMAEMSDEFAGCDVETLFSYDGRKVTSLENGNLSVGAIINNGIGSKTIRVIAALYSLKDGGMLLDTVETGLVSLNGNETRKITIEDTLRVTDSNTQLVKVFVWDESLNPYESSDVFTAADEVVYHVAKNGNDNNSGTESSPLATPSGALTKLYLRKYNNLPYPKDGITIILHEGVYSGKTIYLIGSTYSGTSEAPLTIKAAEGENVIISGAVSLDGGDFVSASDEAKARLSDTSAREHLMQIDLISQGITDFGDIDLPGSYQLPWNSDLPTMPELIINNKVMTVARYPNEGYMKVGSVVDKGAVISDWSEDRLNNPSEEDKNDGFVIKPEDKRYLKWQNATDAVMYGFWKWAWADQAVPLSSIDVDAGTIISSQPGYYPVEEDGYFYTYNLLEEIDSPGEYYIDRQTGILYLYPPENISPETADIGLSVMTNPLLWLRDVSNIRIEGITICNTRGRGAWLESGAENIIFENCVFKNTGETAGVISGLSRRSGFLGCEFSDVNGGVYIASGDTAKLTAGECFAENCTFDNFSRITRTYNGAVTLGGVGNAARHNKISNAPQLAIQFYGNNHVIEYNEIYDVLKEADDMSAIYTGRSWTNRGNKIRYNYIHNLRSALDNGVGIYGVYLDDCFCGVEIEGNIFADMPDSYAVCINGGRDNKVKGNIMANTYGNLYMTSIGTQKTKDMSGFYSSLEASDYKSDIWRYAYPELYSILDNEPEKPVGNIFSGNLLYNAGYTRLEGVAQDLIYMENNVVTDEDPGFECAENGDYTLSEDSDIFAHIKGFHQLPQSKIELNYAN